MIYSKIPNTLFYGFNNKQESILKTISNDKVILVLDYLYLHTCFNGLSFFSIEDILLSYNLKPKSGIGKNNEQIINILNALEKLKLIELIDYHSGTKSFNKCKYSYDLSSKFTLLEKNAVDTIMKHNDSSINNVKLLLLYCYIKSRMYTNSDNSDIICTGRTPKAAYPTYESISSETGLTSESITKYIDALVILDLIRVGNAGLYYIKSGKNKIVRESRNTYVLYAEGWEQELEYSISNFKKTNEDKVFINSREYKNNNKSENGFLGRVKYLMSIGKASQEQIDKYNNIILRRENEKNSENNCLSDIQLSIQSYFTNEKYKDMLLSEIYEDKGINKLFNKYRDIETSLGIIDENNTLLIDRDIYEMIMVWYDEKEPNKFKDLINVNLIIK